MNARNKAFSKLAVLLVKTPDKLFEDRHLYEFVDSIIEAVKEELDQGGEYIRLNIEDGPFKIAPQQHNIKKRCYSCGPEHTFVQYDLNTGCCPNRGRGILDVVEPELIQGYTAEQWQEIIEGGYLCQFTIQRGLWNHGGMKLVDVTMEVGEKTNVWFYAENGVRYTSCRPYREKGVMRPIFVEPSAPEAWCSFFGDHSHVGDERWCVRKHTGHFPTATRYIEL